MEYTLVIMAAGLGSRFGSLKQITPIGPNGEFIIDYSVYDAIRAGFNKIVFIIRKDFYEGFRNTIGKRLEGKVKVEYVFQELDDLPSGYVSSKERVKPWGTAAAIYSARNVIKGSFAVINADDFYGVEVFKELFDGVKNNENIVLGYKAYNTMSKNGSVKRGMLLGDNKLKGIKECKMEVCGDMILSSPLDGSDSFKTSFDTLVSMNAFAFTKDVLDIIVNNFSIFLKDNIDNLNSEYLVPDVINHEVSLGNLSFNIRKTNSKWHGVTYKEDKEEVIKAIDNYIKEGIYPNKLF